MDERINILFDRYLRGACSEAEWQELLASIKDIPDQDTETLDRPLRELWEKARRGELPSKSHLIDTDKMFAVVTAPVPLSSPALARRPRISTSLGWAAALTGIALLLGSLYWKNSGRQSIAARPVIRPVLTPEQVRPGSSKAILTLADGTQVPLDSAGLGTITWQGNTKIVNQGNGTLSYKTGAAPEKVPAQPAAGHPDGKAAYNTVSTARANQYELILADGSKVWLNASSSLRFPAAFTGSDRTVEMTGEAYFEIAKDPARPFHVKVGTSDIEVLGTQFNINAYPDETVLRTSLVEGAVKVSASGKSGVLAPGQEASIPSGGPFSIGPGNVALAAAWKNGYFMFDKAPLPVVMRQIGRWYDLDIEYAGPVPDRLFKGKLQRSLPLSGILHLLQQGGIRVTLEGKTLRVSH